MEITSSVTPDADHLYEMIGNDTLYQIAWCESRLIHYKNNGEVLHGKIDSRDIGLFQISEKYWLDTANKLGYNIYNLDDNIAMAKYIYKKQGISAWNPSKSCWSNR